MGRRRIVHWDEEDAYTSWRRAYCYLQKSGAVAFTKRRTHRRERQEARAALRKDPHNA
ncbi:DNA helicase [Arthrobacter phage SWEP2]|uniref:DNA helicase n=1 Tax=Arthrobacter phage SWEP2 TaxID=2945958 RepID=A0A9E7MI90_9CAUD|nr:DNA helicase [Arthrobacter phage SWEP2]